MAKIKPEFDKRNGKVIGLSVDAVENHSRSARDIEETHAVAQIIQSLATRAMRVRGRREFVHSPPHV